VIALPSIQDVRSYLSDSGWRQEPRTWRQATIWAHADGYEVLVPPRDDLADTGLRLREILGVLAQVEQRPSDEIAGDIVTPFDDIQLYRAVPEGLPDGYIPLDSGVRSLHGIRDLVATSAQAVIAGTSPPNVEPPHTVRDILRQVRLGPTRAGSYVFTLRLPARTEELPTDGAPAERSLLGREIARQLHQVITSVHDAVTAATDEDLTPFERATAAGVTPQLCDALSQLAGRRYRQPFDVTFRWARGLPDHPAAGTVRFAEGKGRLIRAGGAHLGRRSRAGTATLTGVVESLHDEMQGTDRWRVRIRGTVNTISGAEDTRSMWVRLGSQRLYDQAISAHQGQQRIRVSGEISAQQGRTDLVVGRDEFEVLE
jgi:hypothetical protein